MAKKPRATPEQQLASLEKRVDAMIEERRKRVRSKLHEGGEGGRGTRRLDATRTRLVQELDSLELRIGTLKEREAERSRRSEEEGLHLSNLRSIIRQARKLTEAEEADEFGLDPDFIETLQPVVDLLYDRYFRVDAEGAETFLPSEGPAILVANRAGPIAYDALMIAEAVRKAQPGRRLRFQMDPFLGSAPGVGTVFTRVGGVKDVRGNAARLIEEGRLFLFFPEGFEGASKTVVDRYSLAKMSSEFAEVALRLEVPVVPVAVMGAEEAQPVIARLPIVAKLLRWPRFPIPATGAIPLPVKFRIRFGKPLSATRPASQARHKAAAAALRDRTRGAIEAMLHDLLSGRASIFLG